MPVLRLFERARRLEDSPLSRDTLHEHELRESVLQHLSRLLNTRKGSVLMNPGFGMPDFTNMTTNRMDHLASSIKKMISLYEPRLADVKVSLIEDQDDPFSHSFSISALLLADTGDGSGVQFHTIVNGEGNCTIR